MIRIFAGLFTALFLLFAKQLLAQSALSQDGAYQSIRNITNDSARLNKSLDYFAELSVRNPAVARELKDSILLYYLNVKRKSDEIARQRKVIISNEKVRVLLIAMLAMVVFLAIISFYNYEKTNRLNKLIIMQKHDLELIGQVKDRIFSVISHDMRSPVNTLIAFTQLLEHDDLTAEQLNNYTAQIKQSLTYTSVLIDNLLNWASSQMQGFKPVVQNFELGPLVKEVLDSVEPLALKKGIRIKNDVPDLTYLKADVNMTQLILRNLVNNALKYTHENGTVALRAAEDDAGVIIHVQDDGLGMSKQAVENFNSGIYVQFNESTPGTNKEKGTGLGLVLCKNFATLMDGEIKVKSEPGKGSLFSVTLSKG